MPTIFFYGPKVEKEKRREMIESFTETASKATGKPKGSIVVYLREAPSEFIGVGGKLLEDIQKEK